MKYALMDFSHLHQNVHDNILFVCHQKVAHLKTVLLRFYGPQNDHSFKSYGHQNHFDRL